MDDEKNLPLAEGYGDGEEPINGDWEITPVSEDGNGLVSEEERLSALQIAGLTNEEIDARIGKLEQGCSGRCRKGRVRVGAKCGLLYQMAGH